MHADAGATYAAAGVDIQAGDEVVERIKGVVASTMRPGVLGGIGGFGGLFALDMGRYEKPVLVAATDGVGTKLEVARLAGRYDTVGIDLVAMSVDDLVCVGAEPLFLLDYIAVGAVDPARIEELVGGIAEGCRQSRCALLGGETAEHGGTPSDLDLAGFAVGVLEQGHELGPERVRSGDVLLGLGSPGLRSNGYTLARHVLLERAGRSLEAPAWEGASSSLADELLRPSVIYSSGVLDAMAASPGSLHAAAHITGGGIPGNLIRALPDVPSSGGRSQRAPRALRSSVRSSVSATSPRTRWLGSSTSGVGMILIVDPSGATSMLDSLRASGLDAALIGTIEEGNRAESRW